MIIPHGSLRPELLRAIVEEYVTREGTDYGDVVYSLESKVQSVVRQLESGKASIVFDPTTETCDVVVRGTARYAAALASGLVGEPDPESSDDGEKIS